MTGSLDKIDKRILHELRQNARLSNQELSERVGLSPTPCARRVRNMEQSGIIKGYTALIDESALGYGLSVFVSIQLDHQTDDLLLGFEEEISNLPEVMDCWLVTGSRDYILRIALKDMEEYEHFLSSRLTKIPGVSSIETSIPIRRVKEQRTRY